MAIRESWFRWNVMVNRWSKREKRIELDKSLIIFGRVEDNDTGFPAIRVRELTAVKICRNRGRQRRCMMLLAGARPEPEGGQQVFEAGATTVIQRTAMLPCERGLTLSSGAARGLSLFGKLHWRRHARAKNQWGLVPRFTLKVTLLAATIIAFETCSIWEFYRLLGLFRFYPDKRRWRVLPGELWRNVVNQSLHLRGILSTRVSFTIAFWSEDLFTENIF